MEKGQAIYNAFKIGCYLYNRYFYMVSG